MHPIFTADLSDFIPVVLTVTFQPSNNLQCRDIHTTEDTVLEDTEDYIIQLTTVDPEVTLGLDSATIVISDNDSEY